MVLILIFANWSKPSIDAGLWAAIYNAKWIITAILGVAFGIVLNRIFKMKLWKILIMTITVISAHIIFKGNPMITFVIGIIGLSYFTSTSEGELGDWFSATWGFAKQILPLLFIGGALFALGSVAPVSFMSHFTVFVLSCFIGYQVIWNVSASLHTPLMSVTNAISGIIIIGAVIQISSPGFMITILSGLAILIASINIAGGFLVTRRMLEMFKK